METSLKADRRAIRFDRNEFSGAFGDLGTDFPLIVGMILAAGLDSASVLILFGVMQIVTAFSYGIPMPVQPLKAMAVLVITQKLGGNILYGAGLAIGIMMLLLTVTGLVDWLARVVPKPVIRGIQFGLGLQLASLALKDYVRADAAAGYGLAVAGFTLTLLLIGNRRYPPALFVILLGVAYAFLFKLEALTVVQSAGFSLPRFHTPTLQDVLTGFVLLALPQLALSLGNSILATRQIVQDFFPERSFGVRKISLTYSLMNLINPFFSGVPTCHGSGGIAGHYAFGARTGGSTVIEGLLYLLLGLFFSGGFEEIVQVFPLPILGVILLFEGLAMMMLVRDVLGSVADLSIVLLVGLVAGGLPYGYVIGLLFGTVLAYLSRTRLAGFARHLHPVESPRRVLFVCVENSCRSQMAEAFARIHGAGRVEAYSAGSRPSGRVHPMAVESMHELGHDLSTHRSKPLSEIPDVEYDLVVAMGCGDECPLVRARRREDWDIPDPKAMPPGEFRVVRDLIETKVRGLLAKL